MLLFVRKSRLYCQLKKQKRIAQHTASGFPGCGLTFNTFSIEMHAYEELKDTPEYQNWITGDNEGNVTHGGVIAAIMAACFPGEGKNRYQWQPKPGRGYCLRDGTYEAL